MQELVPPDFPRGGHTPALPGYAPKYVARKIDGKYVVGLTEDEIRARHFDCCTLALGMTGYCESKLQSNPEWSPQFLLDRTGLRIASEDWGYTDDEISWVLSRIAAALKLEWVPGRWRQLDIAFAIRGEAVYAAPPVSDS